MRHDPAGTRRGFVSPATGRPVAAAADRRWPDPARRRSAHAEGRFSSAEVPAWRARARAVPPSAGPSAWPSRRVDFSRRTTPSCRSSCQAMSRERHQSRTRRSRRKVQSPPVSSCDQSPLIRNCSARSSRTARTSPIRTIRGCPNAANASASSTAHSRTKAYCLRRHVGLPPQLRLNDEQRQHRTARTRLHQRTMVYDPQIALEPDDLDGLLDTGWRHGGQLHDGRQRAVRRSSASGSTGLAWAVLSTLRACAPPEAGKGFFCDAPLRSADDHAAAAPAGRAGERARGTPERALHHAGHRLRAADCDRQTGPWPLAHGAGAGRNAPDLPGQCRELPEVRGDDPDAPLGGRVEPVHLGGCAVALAAPGDRAGLHRAQRRGAGSLDDGDRGAGGRADQPHGQAQSRWCARCCPPPSTSFARWRSPAASISTPRSTARRSLATSRPSAALRCWIFSTCRIGCRGPARSSAGCRADDAPDGRSRHRGPAGEARPGTDPGAGDGGSPRLHDPRQRSRNRAANDVAGPAAQHAVLHRRRTRNDGARPVLGALSAGQRQPRTGARPRPRRAPCSATVPPGPGDLEAMPTMVGAVLEEAMRLYPPVGLLGA